jgi:opacity protein-like surface antigen
MESIVRVIRFATLLLLPFQAQADLRPMWEDNWVLGVSAGYASRESDIGSSITLFRNFSAYSRNSSDDGVLGAVFVGYQFVNGPLLAGGEFNLEWENINNSHTYDFSNRQVTAEYRRKGLIDLSGRIGYALTENFMPYLRVGAELSRDSLTSTFSGNAITSATLYNKAWIHRFIVGLGVEMPVPQTCGMTLRLEYDFHSKGKTIEAYAATGLEVTQIDYYTAMQPRTYSGRISGVWNIPA